MLAAGYLWALQFPIIKAIWTSSFVLVVSGYSAIVLGLMHQVIDVWGWKAWATIFVWIGANAIALYFINNIVGFEPFALRFVGGDVSPMTGSRGDTGNRPFRCASAGAGPRGRARRISVSAQDIPAHLSDYGMH